MKEIAIVGAGVGGLTAAHALRKAGFGVRVFEQADSLRAAGAGITMQSNAMSALKSLGLDQPVQRAGHVISQGRIATWKGKTINELEMEAISERVPQRGVAIHRKRLMEALAAGLEEELEFGVAIQDVENIEGGVRLQCEDGRSLEAEAVVGCDGLYSAVRRSLFGEESLRYAGYTTWRGVASMPVEDVQLVEMWGPGLRFGLVPIHHDEVYWFAVASGPRQEVIEEPVVEVLREMFAGWQPLVEQVLEATNPEEIISTDCLDRPPRRTWGQRRITLLGDAAHPMMPNLGQGGCQAVESAVVLGRVLTESEGLEAGLRRYEALRMDRANRFVKQSFQMGKMAQWKHPLARGLRDFGMRLAPSSVVRRSLVEQYDFEGWFRRRAL